MGKNKEENLKFREGFRKLYKAEEKFDLFNFSCQGIPLWMYARDKALMITSGFNSYKGQSTAFQKIDFINLVKRIFYSLINFYRLFNNDIIVFTNERHLDKDLKTEKYYNPFAELVLSMNGNFKKVLVFEFPIPMTLKYKKINYERYWLLDPLLFLRQIFSPLSLFYYSRIKKEFSPKLRLANLWEDSETKKILKFAAYSAYNINFYAIFLKIIKFINPKAKIFYSCMGGYDKFPEVIEIQPALILDFQSQYIYPQTLAIKNYLKNKKMMVFSQKTKELLLAKGYIEENVSVIDNPKIRFYFLKNLKKDFFEKKKEFDKKIVIIGNWGGGTEEIFKNLVLDMEKNKEIFKNWEISMVLHPTQKNTYKKLNLTKVKIFENHEVSLWEMLSEAVCTVNIASTVLEESTYFGCFNIILKHKSFEDQNDYIELMCKDYIYKTVVVPEEFVDWFKNNKKLIEDQGLYKKEIMEKNYEYFLKKREYDKRATNQELV